MLTLVMWAAVLVMSGMADPQNEVMLGKYSTSNSQEQQIDQRIGKVE